MELSKEFKTAIDELSKQAVENYTKAMNDNLVTGSGKMELTDKTKEQFEGWYDKTYKNRSGLYSITIVSVFNNLPDSMKFGVYVDYFDSVGVDVLTRKKDGKYISFASPHITEHSFRINKHKNRSKARIAAIEKANEIQNEKLSKQP